MSKPLRQLFKWIHDKLFDKKKTMSQRQTVARARMDWKEFDKVRSDLESKLYHVGWKAYYKDEPVTQEIEWEVAPKEFAYEITSIDRVN